MGSTRRSFTEEYKQQAVGFVFWAASLSPLLRAVSVCTR